MYFFIWTLWTSRSTSEINNKREKQVLIEVFPSSNSHNFQTFRPRLPSRCETRLAVQDYRRNAGSDGSNSRTWSGPDKEINLGQMIPDYNDDFVLTIWKIRLTLVPARSLVSVWKTCSCLSGYLPLQIDDYCNKINVSTTFYRIW